MKKALLLGDSICMGYCRYVRMAFEGSAEIVETEDGYTFVMGAGNVRIVAKYESENAQSNVIAKIFSSYITMAVCAVIALGGVAFLFLRKKQR